VVGKKRKGSSEVLDVPIDLASRIGAPATGPLTAAPDVIRRVDGPIGPDRAARRPLLIGANEAPARPLLIGANEPPVPPIAVREPERPVAVTGRPTMIGLEEARATTPTLVQPEPQPAVVTAPVVIAREAPAQGEMDLVITPLPTPDDWHHFELALRRLPGVGTLRTEYYRAGILKLRLRWSGVERLSQAVSGVPGYRVGILGEDRSTVQIRVVRSA
jgi:hypothetical protein